MRTFANDHVLQIAPPTADAYQYTVLTCKFVNMGRVGLALAVGTTLFVGVVEDSQVIGINVFAEKDIGDEF